MNTIGINNNLDRARIRKLLIIGLVGSIMTGIGDYLVGYGASPETGSLAEFMLASAVNMSDGQLITGGLFGAFGLFLEGLAFFAIYRLIADATPKYVSDIAKILGLDPGKLKTGMRTVAKRVLDITDEEIEEMSDELMQIYPVAYGIYYEECIRAIQDHVRKLEDGAKK